MRNEYRAELRRRYRRTFLEGLGLRLDLLAPAVRARLLDPEAYRGAYPELARDER